MVSRPGRLSDCLVRSDLPQPRASLQVWKDFPRYLGKATKELRSTVGRWNSDHKQSDSGTHLIRAHRPNTCGYFVQLLYGFWCYMEWCEHISVSSSSKTRYTHILRRTVLHGGGGIYPCLADASLSHIPLDTGDILPAWTHLTIAWAASVSLGVSASTSLQDQRC